MSSSSSTCHSEMPPWKLELLQRKKKVMNINTIGHMTQYEMHQNAGKLYSTYSKTGITHEMQQSYLTL